MPHSVCSRQRLARLHVSIALFAILVTIGAVTLARQAAAQEWRGLANDMIRIQYIAPINPANRATYLLLKKRRVLEELSAFLSPLQLRGVRLNIRTQ